MSSGSTHTTTGRHNWKQILVFVAFWGAVGAALALIFAALLPAQCWDASDNQGDAQQIERREDVRIGGVA